MRTKAVESNEQSSHTRLRRAYEVSLREQGWTNGELKVKVKRFSLIARYSLLSYQMTERLEPQQEVNASPQRHAPYRTEYKAALDFPRKAGEP